MTKISNFFSDIQKKVISLIFIRRQHEIVIILGAKIVIHSRLTLESFSLGDTNDVDHLVFSEDLFDGDLLFEMLTGKVDFVSDGSTVQLDFHDVSLLLTAFQKGLLGVTDHTDNLKWKIEVIAKILLNTKRKNVFFAQPAKGIS